MKKKVIFVTEALWIGGIESALTNLLNALDYEKYDVTCLVLRSSLEMAYRIPRKCRLLVADREKTVTFSEGYRFARLYHLTEECANPSRLHRMFLWAVPVVKWVENRLYIRYIRKCLGTERFDTCVIYSDRTAETAVRAVKADRFLMYYHHGAMRRTYHDEIGYQRAEKVIAVSDGIGQKLKEYRPQYAQKVIAVPNLIDISQIIERSKDAIEDKFETGYFHIVSCGRIVHDKGMDIAVNAAAKLIEMGYRNIHWWIVGGGQDEEKIRELIIQKNLQEHVTLLGMKVNPYPYIAKADLFVQPSRIEAYGLTIAEALALGKPVVATDTEGASSVICDGVNGEVCKCDVDKLVNAIESCMDEKTVCANAQEYFQKNNNLAKQKIERLF